MVSSSISPAFSSGYLHRELLILNQRLGRQYHHTKHKDAKAMQHSDKRNLSRQWGLVVLILVSLGGLTALVSAQSGSHQPQGTPEPMPIDDAEALWHAMNITDYQITIRPSNVGR
jgi:hypothetical protein